MFCIFYRNKKIEKNYYILTSFAFFVRLISFSLVYNTFVCLL